MIAAWILYSVLAGALVAAGAYALTSAASFASLPTRWIWAVALGATVVLSAAAPLRARQGRSVAVSIPTAASTTTRALGRQPESLADRVASAAAALSRRTVDGLASVAASLQGRPAWLLAAGWIALSVVALSLLVAVHARFGRLRRRWPRTELAGSSVRVAPDVGPAVIGVARPEIVVPAWLLDRTEREQALVVAHEAEHVRGRDPALLGFAWLLIALVPWNPAAWWMLARLRLAVELDCDARVLRGGVAPRAYGSLLIDLAGRCSGFSAGAPALADTTSHLERRLVAMRPERPRFPLIRAVGAGALALVAVLAACEAKMPTQDDVTSMDAAKAERVATLLEKEKADAEQATKVRYIVDDRPATAEEAHAIASNHIATVNIMKSHSPDGYAVINIHTNGADSVRFKVRPDGGSAEKLEAERRQAELQASLAPGGGNGMIRTADKKKFAGLIIIDGVRSSPSALSTLSQDQIVSVNVMKGEAARATYSDPAAANGVILITTVKGAKK